MLEVSNLKKRFSSGVFFKKYLDAVDDVSFTIARGETLGLVGESGSGKSTVGQCVIRLIEPTSGTVVFDGIDLRRLSGRELNKVRPRMQMIFQDPDSSLDPRMTIGQSIAEPFRLKKDDYLPTFRKHYDPIMKDLPLYCLKPGQVKGMLEKAGYAGIDIGRMDDLCRSARKKGSLLDKLDYAYPIYFIKAEKR